MLENLLKTTMLKIIENKETFKEYSLKYVVKKKDIDLEELKLLNDYIHKKDVIEIYVIDDQTDDNVNIISNDITSFFGLIANDANLTVSIRILKKNG